MTSLDEQHNPYAVPQAELQAQPARSGHAVLYPMSSRKAAVMSVLTLGLYDLVFWYRHWTRLKEGGHDVSPIARTIFAPLAAFSFLTTLTSLRYPRGIESGSLLRMTPFVYFGASSVGLATNKVLEGIPSLVSTVLGCVVSAWVLATIQRGANEVLAADGYQGPSNSGATWSTIVTGVIGLVIWLGMTLTALGIE